MIMESGIYNDGKNLFVIFGGKIGCGSGTVTINDDDKKYACVHFQENSGSYAIGENLYEKEPLAEDKKIMLCFDNVASIDVVIKALEIAKGKLVE
jgi:hypothetical protein